MGARLFDWKRAIAKSSLTATVKHVCLALSVYMDADGGGAYPSLKTLANDTSRRPDTVKKSVDAAEAAGFLVVERGGGRGRSNKYRSVIPQEDGFPKRASSGSGPQGASPDSNGRGASARSNGTRRGSPSEHQQNMTKAAPDLEFYRDQAKELTAQRSKDGSVIRNPAAYAESIAQREHQQAVSAQALIKTNHACVAIREACAKCTNQIGQYGGVIFDRPTGGVELRRCDECSPEIDRILLSAPAVASMQDTGERR